MIINATIKLSSIKKDLIYTSPQTGEKYLSLSLLDLRTQDIYKNDGFIEQYCGKEAQAAGGKNILVGSWKWKIRPEDTPKPKTAPATRPAAQEEAQDDIPW